MTDLTELFERELHRWADESCGTDDRFWMLRAGYEAGRREERAAIAEWLRDVKVASDDWNREYYAYQIETGAHMEADCG